MNNSIKLLAIAALSLTTLGLTQAANYTVPDGTSIQTQINSASNGDTIYVEGNHNETIVINKELSLIASGTATINGGGVTGAIISIETNNVTVDGFNVTNIIGFGISTKNAGNVSLLNIIIKNNTITNIQTYNNLRESGVGIYVGYMDGFYVYENGVQLKSGLVAPLNYAGLIIDNNTMSDVDEGIVAQSIYGGAGTELQITNNHVSDTTAGRNGPAIFLESSSHIIVDHNTSNNTFYGINVSSYLFNDAWVEYNTTGGSSYIYITNNEFKNTKTAGWRDDGAGIAIYGGQVSTMLISGNNLSNNAQYSILLAANDSISAPYNYFGDSPRTVLAKSAINRQRVPFDTAGATINDDPYYYTREKTRTSSSSVTTGDSFATIAYTMQEKLSNTTWTNGTITIGTGSNTSGVTSENIVYGTNVDHGDLGYTGSNTFNLDEGSYSYEITYTTSEGAGITTTGSFTIPLIAYGCVDSFNEAAIYFNTNIINVDMLSPTDESDLFSTPEGRAYPGLSTTFYFEYLGSNNQQTLYVDNTFPTCNGY